MESPVIISPLDILFHEESQLQWQTYATVIETFQPWWEKVIVFRHAQRVTAFRECSARNDLRAPLGPQVIFSGIEDGDEDPDCALCVRSDCLNDCPILMGRLVDGAAGEEGPGKIAD